MPLLSDLDIVPGKGGRRCHEESWRWYIRGNVVSHHSQRLIVQFMSACCGRSARDTTGERDEEDASLRSSMIPENDLSLIRVHSIIDKMSEKKDEKATSKAKSKVIDFIDDAEMLEDEPKDPGISTLVREALIATGVLWPRVNADKKIICESVDCRNSTLDEKTNESLRSQSSQPRKKRSSKQKKRNFHQTKAYCKWNSAVEKIWWDRVLKNATEPLTHEQTSFLECMVQRCKKEQQEMESLETHLHSKVLKKKDTKTDKSIAELSDPMRACLFGIPGAGKSTCIKHLRSFFVEVLCWEDGIDFQFLATQNTMAALIGGQTIHHWGGIPVSLEHAQQKCNSKNTEGDVDQLFLNAMSTRWLVIDEVSTASLTILGLLDSYLRRACSRQPYARRGSYQLPFGGLNIIFAGDLWQLGPVKGKAIFCNPFKIGLGSAEQKIAKMFWMAKEPIQKLFLLTKSLRTTDEWLKALLDSDRYGKESWEMYCFAHGLPTRNVGSWLPNKTEPVCGNVNCAQLKDIWQQRRDDGVDIPWEVRCSMECESCKAERNRRNCIIRDSTRNQERYRLAPFANAPFVHPFRAPSYHAQHLRSLHFANSSGYRVLWVTAYDKMVKVDKQYRPEQEEARRER